jgi:hypothetical protein
MLSKPIDDDPLLELKGRLRPRPETTALIPFSQL